jgi:hypothetical protein
MIITASAGIGKKVTRGGVRIRITKILTACALASILLLQSTCLLNPVGVISKYGICA